MKRIQIVAATIAALAVLSGGALYLRSSSAETKPAATAAAGDAGTGRGRSSSRKSRPGTSSPAASRRWSASTCARASPARCRRCTSRRRAGQAGDLLVTIDPAPYAAEVERAQAQVVAAQARVNYAKSEHERAQRLWDESAIARRELDERVNAAAGSRGQPARRAGRAAVGAAEPGLHQVRAPVSGRVGRLEVTVGNLVAAGPGAPVLTTLVSVNPIYASFDADEHVVLRALHDGPRGIR